MIDDRSVCWPSAVAQFRGRSSGVLTDSGLPCYDCSGCYDYHHHHDFSAPYQYDQRYRCPSDGSSIHFCRQHGSCTHNNHPNRHITPSGSQPNRPATPGHGLSGSPILRGYRRSICSCWCTAAATVDQSQQSRPRRRRARSRRSQWNAGSSGSSTPPPPPGQLACSFRRILPYSCRPQLAGRDRYGDRGGSRHRSEF